MTRWPIVSFRMNGFEKVWEWYQSRKGVNWVYLKMVIKPTCACVCACTQLIRARIPTRFQDTMITSEQRRTGNIRRWKCLADDCISGAIYHIYCDETFVMNLRTVYFLRVDFPNRRYRGYRDYYLSSIRCAFFRTFLNASSSRFGMWKFRWPSNSNEAWKRWNFVGFRDEFWA